MLSLASALISRKNMLSDDGAWLVLLEIDFPGAEPTMRIVRNTEDVVWDSQTWTAFPFAVDTINENNKGEEVNVVVRVSNVSRYVQGILEDTDTVGADITLRVVHSEHLDTSAALTMEFLCTAVVADSEWVSFTLGAKSVFRRRFPQERILKDFCRWRFQSTPCGYSGAQTSCDKTLEDCRDNKSNEDRFGGFPLVGFNEIYV